MEIICIDAEHTKGAGHARNVGIAKAQGKWVLFADCDDYYVNNFIDVLDQYIEKSFDVVYFNYNFIDGETGNVFAPNKLQSYLNSHDKTEEQREFIKYQNNTPWDKLVKREYINTHNMYFEEVPNGNDVLFSLFIAYLTNNIAIESKQLYNYIKNPNSLGTKRQTQAELLCRIDHIIRHSYFNQHIGHTEWNAGLFHYLLSILKQYGFLTFLQLLPKAISHRFNKVFREEWVRIISTN